MIFKYNLKVHITPRKLQIKQKREVNFISNIVKCTFCLYKKLKALSECNVTFTSFALFGPLFYL